MAIRGWRPLALASVVTATLAGAVVLRAALGGDDNDPPANLSEQSATPTTSIAGTSTAEPSLTVVDPVLEKRNFPRGQQVSVATGLGFLSAETGDLETWSMVGAASGDYAPVISSPDGAMLLTWVDDNIAHLVERATGKTWRLAAGISPHLEASHGLVVPALTLKDDTDTLVLLDLVNGSATSLEISAKRPAVIAVVAAPDGRKLAVYHGETLTLVELASRITMKLADSLPTEGVTLNALPGGLGFTLQLPNIQTRRWFSWDGIELERELPLGAVSPNGRYFAAASSPGGIDANTVGGSPNIGSVVVTERSSGKGVIQALSADPLNHADQAWSAASDSLVLQVLEGYRVVSVSGQAGPLIQDNIHVLDPRPSPTIAGLFGTNRGTIINLSRGETIAPLYAELVWRASWTTRPGELAVELNTPGKGRDWPLQVLPFAITTAVSDPPTGVVVTGSACANLRQKPEANGAIVRCLPVAARASIEAIEERITDPKSNQTQVKRYVGIEASDGTVWLHVRLPAGEEGWVDAKSLGWAK